VTFFNDGDPPPALFSDNEAAVPALESKLSRGEAVLPLPLSILPNASDMKSTSMMSAWESFNSDSAMFTSRSTEVSVMGVSRIGFRCGDLPLL
jgi:hypothetical protein